MSILKEIKIPVPPLSKQKKIVEKMKKKDKDILNYYNKAKNLEKEKINFLSKI